MPIFLRDVRADTKIQTPQFSHYWGAQTETNRKDKYILASEYPALAVAVKIAPVAHWILWSKELEQAMRIKKYNPIPAYAVCKKNKFWAWSVWTQRKTRRVLFADLTPTHSGTSETKAQAIAAVSEILGLDLLSCKICMVSRPRQVGEGVPAYQSVPFCDADVIQLWSNYVKI